MVKQVPAIPDPDDNNIVFNISSGSTVGGGAPFTRNNIKTGQNESTIDLAGADIWPERFGHAIPLQLGYAILSLNTTRTLSTRRVTLYSKQR